MQPFEKDILASLPEETATSLPDDLSLDFMGGASPEKHDGPLASVEYANNFPADSAAEFSATRQAFKERAQAEEKRRRLATDSEYWCCLCFQTREQKDAFLAALKLSPDDDKYIDGRVLARKLNIELPANPEYSKSRIDSDWIDLAMEI